MDRNNDIAFSFESMHHGDTVTFHLKGALTRQTVVESWQQLNVALKGHTQSPIIFDVSKITQADSYGFVTLHELMQQAPNDGSLQGLSPSYQALWTSIHDADREAPIIPLEMTLSSIERMGKAVLDKFKVLKENITYLGEIVFYMLYFFRHPRILKWSKLCFYLEDIGPNALPLTVLIGVLFGVILSFQSGVFMKQFGAEIYVTNLVAISMIRELGPLLTAIIIIGRSASSYAAEISAMKANQEIDALQTMGLSPVPYLVIPRIIAAGIISPLLTLIMNICGMAGCTLFLLGQGYSTKIIFQQMMQYMGYGDLLSGLFKSVVFGMMVISIGCIHGLNSGKDTLSVGVSTTSTVVRSIVMITVVDGIFTTLFYFLGI